MYAVRVYADDHDFLSNGWPQGGYDVCHACAGEGFPDKTPALQVPRDMPEGWGDYWCPICQQFMREDDPAAQDMRCLRLMPEDVLEMNIKPGVKRCCSSCWEIFAPIVVDRWKREGLIPPALPVEAIGLNLV